MLQEILGLSPCLFEIIAKKSLSDYWKKDQTHKYVAITLKTSKACVRISVLVSTSGISSVYFHSG